MRLGSRGPSLGKATSVWEIHGQCRLTYLAGLDFEPYLHFTAVVPSVVVKGVRGGAPGWLSG